MNESGPATENFDEISYRRRLLMRRMLALGAVPLVPFTAWAGTPLRLAYFDNAAPFSWLNHKREMQGIFIDILNEALQRRLGITLRHEGFPWKRAQQMVKDGEADALCTLPTPERRAFTEISGEPVFNAAFTMFTRAAGPQREKLQQVTTLQQLQPFTIAAYNGSGWSKQRLDGMQVDWALNIDAVLKKLALGRGDVHIDVGAMLRPRIKALGLADELLELPQVLDTQPCNLCIRKGSPHVALLPAFDKTIRDMRKDGSLRDIFRRYDALPAGV